MTWTLLHIFHPLGNKQITSSKNENYSNIHGFLTVTQLSLRRCTNSATQHKYIYKSQLVRRNVCHPLWRLRTMTFLRVKRTGWQTNELQPLKKQLYMKRTYAHPKPAWLSACFRRKLLLFHISYFCDYFFFFFIVWHIFASYCFVALNKFYFTALRTVTHVPVA